MAVDGSGATDTLYGQYMLKLNAKYALYQAVASGDINRSVTPNHAWYAAWAAIDAVLALGIAAAYIFLVHKGVVMPLIKKDR